MGRHARSLALLFLVPASVLLAGATESGAPGAAWFPLEPGSRARFDVHRDRSVRPEQGAPLRMLWVGWADETVQRHGERLRLHTVTNESLAERNGVAVVGTPSRTIDIDDYAVADGAVLLHRRLREAPASPDEEAAYDPPLRVLAGTVAPGSRWTVGTLAQGDSRIDLEAEVIGLESLVLSEGRRVEGCLRVAYRGAIRSAGGAESVNGRYERDAWFARDLGLVQEHVRIDFDRTEAEGITTLSERVRRVRRIEPPG
jgi:hypothetical protein